MAQIFTLMILCRFSRFMSQEIFHFTANIILSKKVKLKCITFFNVTAVEIESAVLIEPDVKIELAVLIEPAVLQWVVFELLTL